MVEKINAADFANERHMKSSDRERQARKNGRVPVWGINDDETRRGGEISAKKCDRPETDAKTPLPEQFVKSKCEKVTDELHAAKSMIKSCLNKSELATIFGIDDRPMLKFCTVAILLIIAFTLGFMTGKPTKKSVYHH